LRQTAFIFVIGLLFLTCGYFYWEHAVKKLPVNRPVEEMARAVNLNGWEVETSDVISMKYGLQPRQMFAIAAELRVLRSNRMPADEKYITDLSRRRGLREDQAAGIVYDYTVYLAALGNVR